MQTCLQVIHDLEEKKPLNYEDMLLLCNLPGSIQSPGSLHFKLREHLHNMRYSPMVALLVTKENIELRTLFAESESNTNEMASALIPPPSPPPNLLY